MKAENRKMFFSQDSKMEVDALKIGFGKGHLGYWKTPWLFDPN